MKKIIVSLAIGSLFALCGVSSAQTKDEVVTVTMKGTAADSQITGTVKLTETVTGLKVEADLMNVPNPGEHGFHIHEVGSCEDMGKAAGGHFNPDKVEHGLVMKNGHQHAHAGDMGNIVVDKDGHATLEAILPDVGLVNGKYLVSGLSIILHEKADDFGQPTGNAGGRIACGIIPEIKK